GLCAAATAHRPDVENPLGEGNQHMNHMHKLTQHQLTARIAREVGRRNDPHEVFAVTREVTNDYRQWANEAMARLVYTASEAKQKNSVFSEGFAAIVKQHAKVLAAVNEA